MTRYVDFILGSEFYLDKAYMTFHILLLNFDKNYLTKLVYDISLILIVTLINIWQDF